ncbi:MAG: hypothetical protein AB7O97_09125 [Planctomycetota bacterium]
MARAGEDNPFPLVVAWLGLGLALLLFFANTVPAVREQKELRATADELQRLRARYDAAIAHAWSGTPGGAGAQDLQSVLVAIDRIGWTPAELLHSYPDRMDAVGSPDPSAPRRD